MAYCDSEVLSSRTESVTVGLLPRLRDGGLGRLRARSRLLLAALKVFPQCRRKPRLARRALIRLAAWFTGLGHPNAQSMT